MARLATGITIGFAALIVLIAGAAAGTVQAMSGSLAGEGIRCRTGCGPVVVSSAGWTRPVVGTVGSGFRTAARPGHDGVDLIAARGTVIRAASAGTVVRVRCNIAGHSWDAPFATVMPCDTDGYPGLGGCGWYAEVRHAGNIESRYCHMIRRPLVTVGQIVATGQPLGYVGTSGNSSGPHLHYEIHENYPATESNATDPIPFMAGKGVSL